MSVDLARMQRGVAALIRGASPPVADPWLKEVASSPRLGLVQYIITSWREMLLRRSAPLTIALLEDAGRLHDAFARIGTRPESPFAEELACAFLAGFVDDEDPLVAEVARFEIRMYSPRQSGV
jgi:hypothetical protein